MQNPRYDLFRGIRVKKDFRIKQCKKKMKRFVYFSMTVHIINAWKTAIPGSRNFTWGNKQAANRGALKHISPLHG